MDISLDTCDDLSFKAQRESLFLVLSGPGGTGKTSLIKRWLSAESDLRYVPNVTTRKPRNTPTVDESGMYEFVSRAEFRSMVERDAFAQWVNPSEGKYYGTPIKPLLEAIEQGHDVVFDYTPQLYINLKRCFRERVVGVFIVPPTLRDLLLRLKARGSEQGEDLLIKYRMGLQDLAYIDEHDYHVVNDDLTETLEILQSIRISEHHKLTRSRDVSERCKAVSPRSMLFYYDPLDLRIRSIANQ